MKNKISLIFYFFLFICFSCKTKQPLTSLNVKSIIHKDTIVKELPDKLITEFKNPPTIAKPKALWDWIKGNYSLSQITKEMEDAKAKGLGGFDIWDVGVLVDPPNVIPAGPQFLGDESLHAIGHAIREGKRLGLEIGLITSSSWNSGGTWVKPEHGVMGLYESTTIVKGGDEFKGKLAFPKLPEKYSTRGKPIRKLDANGLPEYYKEVGVLAFPVSKDSIIPDASQIINLNHLMKKDGSISWLTPKGEWQIVRYVCAPTGQPLVMPSPNSRGRMLDHFSAEAAKENIMYVINRLQKELGDLKTSGLKYLYVDSYEANSAAWTPLLPEEFKKRNGYDITPYLPALKGQIVTNENITNRFLFDFKKTLSDLIIENHYAQSTKICKEYGLGFYAEAGGPGPPVHNVPFEDLKALGALTVPRGEFWGWSPAGKKHQDKLQIIKGIASASHIYNQKYVEAESFTSLLVWQEGLAELKPLADRAFCEGLNRIVYHTYPHTPPESGSPGWVYNFGTLMYPHRAWWPMSGAFHNYLARTSYLLQQGNFVGDVAYYYGDKAPNFVKAKKIESSLGFGYDYDKINSDIILNRLKVVHGKFVLPHGQTYEVLVLPNEKTINPEVLAKLEMLVKAGGIVIGKKPTKSYRLFNYEDRDKQVEILADKLWGDCDSIMIKEHIYGKGKIVWGKTIQQVLLEKGILPDFSFIGFNSSIDSVDYIHRTTATEEIYFIRNIEKRAIDIDALFRVYGKQPEIWNPETGEISKQLIFNSTEDGISLPIHLEAEGSIFIVFRDKDSQRSIASIENDIGEIIPEIRDNKLIVFKAGKYTLTHYDGQKNTIEIPNIPTPIQIKGSWDVRFPREWVRNAITNFPSLQSWTDSKNEDIKHFSGVASYRKQFTLDKITKGQHVYLNLGNVKEVTQVYVNGKNLGIKWHAPYWFNITNQVLEGNNYLTIEVANVLSNRLTGDAKKEQKNKRTYSNVTKGKHAWDTPFEDLPLHESGLLGPVTIEFGQELINSEKQ
jgi:hypothetical protein